MLKPRYTKACIRLAGRGYQDRPRYVPAHMGRDEWLMTLWQPLRSKVNGDVLKEAADAEAPPT